jgi:hypothetical protein
MPSNSWVAKWNNLEGMLPGIYAIKILGNDENGGEEIPRKMKNNNQNNLFSDPEDEDFD